jgi:hypothetical protein
MDVGETFLHDSENCEFQIRGKPPKIVRDVEINRNAAALRDALQVPTESRL